MKYRQLFYGILFFGLCSTANAAPITQSDELVGCIGLGTGTGAGYCSKSNIYFGLYLSGLPAPSSGSSGILTIEAFGDFDLLSEFLTVTLEPPNSLASFDIFIEGGNDYKSVLSTSLFISPTDLESSLLDGEYVVHIATSLGIGIPGSDPWASIYGTEVNADDTEGFETSFVRATIEYDAQVVPVPATVWLFGSGLISLIAVARKKVRV